MKKLLSTNAVILPASVLLSLAVMEFFPRGFLSEALRAHLPASE